MDILHLTYFTGIVKNDYNLSKTARELHITQSALSQLISNFEAKENTQLFLRKNNRLIGLTPSGTVLYKYGIQLIALHEEMLSTLRKTEVYQKIQVKIGIPSLILTAYYPKFFSDIRSVNEMIEIRFIEAGTSRLKELLYTNELDFAILADNILLSEFAYEQKFVLTSQVNGYVRENHPLLKQPSVTWEDIVRHDIATLSDDFATFLLVSKKLSEFGYNKSDIHTSSSGEYLQKMSEESDTIAFIPDVIDRTNRKDRVIKLPIEVPLKLTFYVCRSKIRNYSNEENMIYQYLINRTFDITREANQDDEY